MGVGKGPGIKAPKYCGLQPLQKQMSWKLQQAVLAEPLKLLQHVTHGCDLVLPDPVPPPPTDSMRSKNKTLLEFLDICYSLLKVAATARGDPTAGLCDERFRDAGCYLAPRLCGLACVQGVIINPYASPTGCAVISASDAVNSVTGGKREARCWGGGWGCREPW
ncbi:hypothetical protein mRhiFer1_008319 [Rhinolophus ferrumequinum]|uniref:Uncharacterized protein n=1 Tax=Rhinolophus ferrumequinum TaxID=59479 RepID=A0A7J7VRH1_RHIFE|nr:hypothetical protein mRhiFer1_008319 [Rhinolophus ferrumequinum]